MAVKISIDRSKTFQTMQGFGASGAWWAQYVGGLTQTDPESGLAIRDRISELLYSKEKGLGINIFRFNIGAGSKGGPDKINNELRYTETFEVSEGVYDWERDANAVYMMKKATEDGADEIILFVNSPPVRLTKNGKSHLDKIFSDNLSSIQYSKTSVSPVLS
jgi:O-glycosyl hydrolase